MARNKILFPEAREKLDLLKAQITNSTDPKNAQYEVANEQGIHLNKGYNGNIRAKDAGKIGGNIGGKMVSELINLAKKEINK